MMENYRPNWLRGLELDFYFPTIRLAVEFQGDQHFIPTKDFGDCKAQRRRDRAKTALTRENGICLVKVMAFDLQYSRMRWLLKRALFQLGRRFRILSPNERLWALINEDAIAYRQHLYQNFASPTARCRRLFHKATTQARKKHIP